MLPLQPLQGSYLKEKQEFKNMLTGHTIACI